jgi:hypothetical protein
MNAFNNIGIRFRIWIGFGMVLSVLLAVATIGSLAISRIKADIHGLTQSTEIRSMARKLSLDSALLSGHAREFGFMGKEEERNAAQESAQTLRKHLANAAMIIRTPEGHEITLDIADHFDTYMRHFDEVIALKSAQKPLTINRADSDARAQSLLNGVMADDIGAISTDADHRRSSRLRLSPISIARWLPCSLFPCWACASVWRWPRLSVAPSPAPSSA